MELTGYNISRIRENTITDIYYCNENDTKDQSTCKN